MSMTFFPPEHRTALEFDSSRSATFETDTFRNYIQDGIDKLAFIRANELSASSEAELTNTPTLPRSDDVGSMIGNIMDNTSYDYG
jgi:hypothetical protein